MVIPTGEPEIDKEVTEISDPTELMDRGNRSMKLGDNDDAVAAFSRACSLLSGQYGELSHQCADAYLCYGKALLELYRQESNPVEQAAFNDTNSLLPSGHRVHFTDDEDVDQTEADEKDETADQNDVEEVESTTSSAMDIPSEFNEITDEDKTILKTYLPSKFNKIFLDDDSSTTIASSSTAATTKDPDVSSTTFANENGTKENMVAADAVASSSSQASNVDENIEENDLELAWEMLELAKKIYESRETSDECNNLLSQTFMTLGEVSMENENFPLAVDDMNKAIHLMKQLTHTEYAKDRDLSQAYFKLGTTFALNLQTDSAIEAFEMSKKYLNARLEKLDADTDEAQEIKDVIIKELEEKIEETRNLKKEEIETVGKLLNKNGNQSSVNGSGSGDGSGASSSSVVSNSACFVSSSSNVNNISHLVKRKRKMDEAEISSTASSVKLTKLAQ